MTRVHIVLLAALVAGGGGWVGGQVAQGGPPPAATGTGFLAGQVVEQPSGRGVPGASVFLVGRGGRAMTVARGAANPWSVTADVQGRFFFADLPPGPYTLGVSKNGYNPAGGSARIFDVADAERITDLKIRLVKLATLAGTLRDDAGDPVVGTEVMAFRRTVVGGRRTFSRTGTARSDDRGAYRLANLVPGEYVICACSRDPIPFDNVLLTSLAADPLQLMGLAARALKVGADAASIDATVRTFAPTFHPNSPTVARATSVMLAPGDDKAGVDVDLTPIRAARVSGTVTGAIGPLEASALRLMPAGESDDAAALMPLTPMLVQPDGRFDFATVPVGQYVLRVMQTPTDGRAGGAPSGAALQFLGARASSMGPVGGPQLPNEPPLWAAEPISVGDSGVSGLSIALRRTAGISGRLQFVGATPQPPPDVMSRAFVVPIPSSPDSSGLGYANVGRVVADGTFRLPGLLPGRYALSANGAPGWPTLKSIVIAGIDVTDLPLEIEATDIKDVELTFVDIPMGTIEGTVADARARPIPDTTLLVFPADRRYWRDPVAARRRFRSGTVSRNGSVTITSLPAGDYFLVSVPDEAATEWQEASRLESLSQAAQRVTLADGERKAVEIKR